MNRRDLFKKLLGACVVVALPQLAFRAKQISFDTAYRCELDTEYRCIMTAPGPDMVLVSTSFTVAWGDPSEHVVIESFTEG